MKRWEREYCSEGYAPDDEVVEQMHCPHRGEGVTEVP
jgi:hypothetical protein